MGQGIRQQEGKFYKEDSQPLPRGGLEGSTATYWNHKVPKAKAGCVDSVELHMAIPSQEA